MPNINLYQSYTSKRHKFGVNDTERFRQSYLDAVNLTYSELNSDVFLTQLLESVPSFDDIIDNRLISFTTLTFDTDADTAIESREFWSVEYDFERLSTTNGFTDTIADDASNVVISILNGVLTVTGDTITGTFVLPTDLDVFTLKFESWRDGNRVFINGDEFALTFTLGDGDTTQKIGAVTTHIVSGVSGYNVLRTRFLSAGSLIYDFLMNEGTTPLISSVGSVDQYEIVVDGGVWNVVYIEPSSGLDSQYLSPFNMGLDFHLQDGGEWAIEPEAERERKWYGRGIRNAKNILQHNTTYVDPLGKSQP